jgi:hypothetical protein
VDEVCQDKGGPGECLRRIDSKLLAERVVDSFKQKVTDEQIIRLANAFDEFQSGSETELHRKGDPVCTKVFENPQPITTLTGLRARTLAMLRQQDYNQLAVVAETGEWLLDEAFQESIRGAIKERGAKVLVLVAFEHVTPRLVETYGSESIHIVSTSWWRHNRHAAVLCMNEVPLRAIYFVRRLRSAFITPAYLSTREDATRVLGHVKRQVIDGLTDRKTVSASDVSVSLSSLIAKVEVAKSASQSRATHDY